MKSSLRCALTVLAMFPSHLALASSLCPDEEKPKMILALKKQEHTLYVCGTTNTEDRPQKGFRSYSDIKIFAKQTPDPKKKKKAQKKPAPDTSPSPAPEPKIVFEGGPLENFWIKKGEDHLLVDEVWPIVDANVAMLSRKLTCTAKACKLGKPTCNPQQKKKPFPDALKELRALLKDPATPPEADLKTLVSQVFAQALAGDSKARAFFMGGKKPATLVEEASDEWHASKALLGRARKAGCLR